MVFHAGTKRDSEGQLLLQAGEFLLLPHLGTVWNVLGRLHTKQLREDQFHRRLLQERYWVVELRGNYDKKNTSRLRVAILAGVYALFTLYLLFQVLAYGPYSN